VSGELHFQMVRELLHTEAQYRTASRRVGLYDAIDRTLRVGGFDNAEEALQFKLKEDRELASLAVEETVAPYQADLEEAVHHDL
jgi:DNA sulfur modification protein DndC